MQEYITQSHTIQKLSTHESISTFMKMYSTTTYLKYKKSTTMEHTASQKRQNVTNSPTAAQPVRLDTPGPPLRV